ncbi:MAG: nickel-dependent lactate racemase, partial [Promethearchaeota archaeon]
MKIDFKYGKNGLQVEIPEKYKNVRVIEPVKEPPLRDPSDEVYKSFKKPMSSEPLKKLLEKRKDGEIIIVIEDHTRPLQSKFILDALTKIFEELIINDREIKILVGQGLHKNPTFDELERMVGNDVINKYDIIFHNAKDIMSVERVGKNSFGNEIYLNSRYINAGFRIVTGYVEPHMFAGFSGGRKSLVPGIAGKATIMNNHSSKNIDSLKARFGILQNNPIHLDALEAAKLAKPDYCINVTINPEHEITKVASGNIISVHNYLVQAQSKVCFKRINKRYDVVVVGSGGYPF